jgi:hypothetical protein
MSVRQALCCQRQTAFEIIVPIFFSKAAIFISSAERKSQGNHLFCQGARKRGSGTISWHWHFAWWRLQVNY